VRCAHLVCHVRCAHHVCHVLREHHQTCLVVGWDGGQLKRERAYPCQQPDRKVNTPLELKHYRPCSWILCNPPAARKLESQLNERSQTLSRDKYILDARDFLAQVCEGI
jgi:hypothetical protein